MNRILKILNLIMAIITILMGYLANTRLFNENTIASISAKYENLITPASYAFSIWGAIYLGIFGFSIYYGRSLFKKTVEEDPIITQVGWWFIISCCANSLWVVTWLYDYIFLSVVMMIILLFTLLKILINTKMELHNAPLKKYIFIWWPFSLYAGWISIALIANIAAYLIKIQWDKFGLIDTGWAVCMILIATGINILIIWKRNLREFAIVGVWSLIAIAIANKNTNSVLLWISSIMSILIFVNIVIHGFKNRKHNVFSKPSLLINRKKQ